MLLMAGKYLIVKALQLGQSGSDNCEPSQVLTKITLHNVENSATLCSTTTKLSSIIDAYLLYNIDIHYWGIILRMSILYLVLCNGSLVFDGFTKR
jgi:hypothetical protein